MNTGIHILTVKPTICMVVLLSLNLISFGEGNDSNADHYEVKELKGKVAGDVVSVTVNPPGIVLTGHVDNKGGWPWVGGPATFNATIPDDFAGVHASQFSGTWTKKKTGGNELGKKPKSLTWEMDVSAHSCSINGSWTKLPKDESEITFEDPSQGMQEIINDVQASWEKTEKNVNESIKALQRAVDKLSEKVPKNKWKLYDWGAAATEVARLYDLVMAARKELSVVLNTVNNDLTRIGKRIKRVALARPTIKVKPLTGQTLEYTIDAEVSDWRLKCLNRVETRVLSSESFGENLGTYVGLGKSELLEGKKHRVQLKLNGNHGRQVYHLWHKCKPHNELGLFVAEKEFSGMTEEVAFLQLFTYWKTMENRLNKIQNDWDNISFAIGTIENIIDAIPIPTSGDVLDIIAASLEQIDITITLALKKWINAQKNKFMKTVANAGHRIERLPEKDPVGEKENTDSVQNAKNFPYVAL